MFVDAIDKASRYTRPIHSIWRNYGSKIIQTGAATLFFVNSEGWALTCCHVAKQLIAGDELIKKRKAFQDELEKCRGQKKEKQLLKELEKRYGYSKTTPFELHNRFINCVDGLSGFEIRMHKEIDMALIHFTNFKRLECNTFPIFAADGKELKQGKFVCRLGFPFAEFTNYVHDSATDTINWTATGRADTPRFPLEGMVTRHLLDEKGNMAGFELSTPGLKGQSGGPVFDAEGKIWGMQSATGHLDLDFDITQEVLRNGTPKKVSDHVFLHVGHCIHIDSLKSFMSENGVKYTEG